MVAMLVYIRLWFVEVWKEEPWNISNVSRLMIDADWGANCSARSTYHQSLTRSNRIPIPRPNTLQNEPINLGLANGESSAWQQRSNIHIPVFEDDCQVLSR
jgi:hypothetical protein